MNKPVASRRQFTALVLLIVLALVIAPAGWQKFVSAQIGQSHPELASDLRLREQRHRDLKSRLAAGEASRFQPALAELSTLDEPGTLDLWRAALKVENPTLKQQAWNQYQQVRLDLERKEFIPRWL